MIIEGSTSNVQYQKPRLSNGAIAVLLGLVTVIILTLTASSIGVTWDEPAYISSAESYMGWFGVLFKKPSFAMRPSIIDAFWSATHEHPPVDRIWSGAFWAMSRHFLDDLTAHRLGNIVLVGIMVALLYLLIAREYGRPAGLFASAGLMLMPRFFFHSHLAALDMPVTAGIFIVTFVFWTTRDRPGWAWGLLLGLLWGLTEGIKLNATFLPIVFVVWFLIFKRRWYMVLRLFLMGVSGVMTFFLVWPWMYHDTWPKIVDYFNFHFHHFPIGVWYLGHYYQPPPWHYVFVILAVVTPLTTMILALIGAVRARRGRQDGSLGWLLIISALVPMLVLAASHTLAYDGERLFMPTFPFVAGLAGAGFGWLVKVIRPLFLRFVKPKWLSPLFSAIAIVLLLPQGIAIAGLYPHLLSYYSEGIGGLRGATTLKLETTYWCESYMASLPYINAHAKSGDRIWVEPWSYDVMIYYQLHGLLRKDVNILNSAPGSQSLFGSKAPQPIFGDYYNANWIVVEYRQTQFDQMGGSVPALPDYLKKLKPPEVEISYEGIPIMQLYER